MRERTREFLVLAGAAGITVLLMFLGWEVIENQFAGSDETANLMHYARGISSSLVTVFVVGWISLSHTRSRSAQLEAEVARRTHEARTTRAVLQQVVDAAPAALILLDSNHNVMQANKLARKIHGEEIIGQRCHEAFGGDERRRICPGCDTLKTKSHCTAPRDFTDPKTGEILSIESYPVVLPDGDDAVLLVERIITEQKKLQASLLHQEKMAAFGLVAAGVAHEIGNPLSAIEMHLQLLADSALSEEDADSIATLRQEAARLRRTLRELVDFARRRRDESTLVSVESVVRDALRLMRFDRRMRRIDVQVETSIDTPPVEMVEDHLMQVILNLIINALDAMPGGGKLKIDTRYVGGQVVVRVRDNGSGMSHDVLRRCFEPMYSTKAPGKGTGLGLPICKDVVSAIGGDIELHSADQGGTTAIVTLPAARESASPRSLAIAQEGALH